mmetsp:Transcript_89253/g.177448  ORF Transcript_89253/g.177448 Transcript_89253/m.177448 type:complete len:232 (-) Transcript_89253:208-903(-)
MASATTQKLLAQCVEGSTSCISIIRVVVEIPEIYENGHCHEQGLELRRSLLQALKFKCVVIHIRSKEIFEGARHFFRHPSHLSPRLCISDGKPDIFEVQHGQGTPESALENPSAHIQHLVAIRVPDCEIEASTACPGVMQRPKQFILSVGQVRSWPVEATTRERGSACKFKSRCCTKTLRVHNVHRPGHAIAKKHLEISENSPRALHCIKFVIQAARRINPVHVGHFNFLT